MKRFLLSLFLILALAVPADAGCCSVVVRGAPQKLVFTSGNGGGSIPLGYTHVTLLLRSRQGGSGVGGYCYDHAHVVTTGGTGSYVYQYGVFPLGGGSNGRAYTYQVDATAGTNSGAYGNKGTKSSGGSVFLSAGAYYAQVQGAGGGGGGSTQNHSTVAATNGQNASLATGGTGGTSWGYAAGQTGENGSLANSGGAGVVTGGGLGAPSGGPRNVIWIGVARDESN